jgi:hypothetical protein
MNMDENLFKYARVMEMEMKMVKKARKKNR